MKQMPKVLCLFLTAVLIAMIGMSGCGKKETDPNATEVMKISLTPEPTPTPEPSDVSDKAVTRNGSVTMVNEYLNQKIAEEKAAAEAAEGEETSETGESEEASEEEEESKEE